MELKRLFLPRDVKAKGDGGRFTAIANRTGVIDLGNDLTMPGAFRDNLREHGPYRPIFWSHINTEIIGIAKLEETSRGLEIVEGTLNLDVARGREAFALLKMDPSPIGGVSIGWNAKPRDVSFEGQVRKLHRIQLYEVSLVSHPMNVDSIVESVDKSDLDALVASIRRINAEARASSAAPTRANEDIRDAFRRLRLSI